MDIDDNPLECGFDKYVNIDSDIAFLGKEKLKKIKEAGIKKKLMGVKIETNSASVFYEIPIYNENILIGKLRSAGFSPKFKKVVGIAMVKKGFWNLGQKFQIFINKKVAFGEICNLPIL